MSKCDEFVQLLNNNCHVDGKNIRESMDEYENPDSELIGLIETNGFWFHMQRWYEEVFIKNGF